MWPPELKIYDFDSDWYDRHPELYEPPRSFIGMPDLHPVNPLHAATRPEWLAAAADAARVLIAQTPSDPAGFDSLLSADVLAVFGRADAVAPRVADALGIAPNGERRDGDFWVSTGEHRDTPTFDRPYVPDHCVVDVAEVTAVL